MLLPHPTTVPDGLGDPLEVVRRHGGAERWLAVLVTRNPARTDPSVSVVNAGVLPHPRHGHPVVAFVARAPTAKLVNLRRLGRATLVFRHEWEWIAVTGPTELAGPDDPLPGVEAADLPTLLRDIYRAAGGRHDDLDAYDTAMADERRAAVLLTPEKFATNPPGTDHVEHQETS